MKTAEKKNPIMRYALSAPKMVCPVTTRWCRMRRTTTTIVVASTSAIQHDRMPSVRSPGAASSATPTPIVPTASTTRSPRATGPGSWDDRSASTSAAA